MFCQQSTFHLELAFDKGFVFALSVQMAVTLLIVEPFLPHLSLILIAPRATTFRQTFVSHVLEARIS
jgi:hypothetical protein